MYASRTTDTGPGNRRAYPTERGTDMSTIERSVSDAVSDALTWQADSRNRVGGQPPTAEDTYKDAALSLGSPGAAVAVAILSAAGLPPVPLGDDLKPSAAQLSTYQAVYDHFRGRHHDGVAVELGEHAGGTVLVAQYGTSRAWQAWQRVDGVEVHRRIDDYGNAREVASPLPMPRATSLTWQPPTSPLRSSGVHVGSAAIEAAGSALRPDAAPAEPGWLLYAVAATDGRSLTFKDRKADRFGVSVVASGFVPLFARRPDGATLTASGTPMAEPMPDWLLDALGGRWATSKAGAR